MGNYHACIVMSEINNASSVLVCVLFYVSINKTKVLLPKVYIRVIINFLNSEQSYKGKSKLISI
jgi:hypothetical protein